MRNLEYKDYIEGTRKVLEQSKTKSAPYKVTVLGREFIVFPNVFSPEYFKDTELFAKNIPVKKGEEMLEIGSGTGAISITAIYKGAGKVVANIELHNMKGKVEVRQGDLYVPLELNEKFDTIFWNTPFGFVESEEISDLEKAVYDPGYKTIERFIKGAKEYLKVGGRILIGFSTTLGRMDLVQRFAKEAGFVLRMLLIIFWININ